MLAFAALFTGLPASAQIDITERQGNVEVLFSRSQAWMRVTETPFRVENGDKIRTGGGSSASLQTPDGSKVLLASSSEFSVEASGAKGADAAFKLDIGSLKAWVTKSLSRRFRVRTPTAVCAVRGTQFLVDVAASRATLIEVSEGVVAVKTLLGEEVELGDGRSMRSIRVLPDKPLERAAERAAAAPAKAAAKAPKAVIAAVREKKDEERSTAPKTVDDEFKKDVEREVALGLSKEAVQAAAAIEARTAEYQEGKTLIDVFGKRVRLEEYVVRPAADQFKLVALSERADRLDYFYYQARFNQNLPEDLTQATRHLAGKTGAAPDYFVTEFETGRSNTRDAVVETGIGGHLVNTPLAAEKIVYDGGANAFTTAPAGTAFWETLFDNYSYKINGREKFGWQPALGANVTSYDYVAGGVNTRVWNGAGTNLCANLACENALRTSVVSRPSGANSLHDRVTITYTADNSFETYDFYVVSDEGRLAVKADFGGVTAGKTYKEKLIEHNFQQKITASEFGERSIDFVVEPKILIKAGVIQ